MAVNLAPPDSASLHAVAGVELGVAAAGVRRAGKPDLLVVKLAPGSIASGVFTRNRFSAAPVSVARNHLARRMPRALVVNTGNANAGTGADGLRRAVRVCRALASHVGCATESVLPFSTGVIMEPLPDDRIRSALPEALASRADWLAAARTIMTTDTVPKASSRRVRLSSGTATVTGIAKGAGMIRPDMATMLAFICTDAALSKAALRPMVRQAAAASFHCISVDGDTSTNDAFILIATRRGPAAISAADRARVAAAITEVAQTLAQSIVRDGEGATKFITLHVQQGKSVDECRRIAYAIAHSPLVKTAFFASDPNLGRILAAIGNVDIDLSKLRLYLDGVLVATGKGRHPSYREEQGRAVLRQAEFTVRVALGRGTAQAKLWTCDLSFDYVKINAEYRT